MCLGEFGTVVDVDEIGAAIEFVDGSVRRVSTVVLMAEGIELVPGNRVLVSMGLALRVAEHHDEIDRWR